MESKIEDYKATKKLGEGMYGIVYRAYHKTNGKEVALKQIRMENENEGVPASAIREIVLLKELKHPNVVELFDVMLTDNGLFLWLDLCSTDLYGLLKSNNFSGLELPTIKRIMHGILCGLKYIHGKKMMHRDLKPQNILYTSDGVPKIADFGLGRAFGLPFKHYSQEYVTLYYRCPELLLRDTQFTTAVDIWSVGWIFAELYTGKTLFKGSDNFSQLEEIYKIMGSPNHEQWPEYSTLPLYEHFETQKGNYDPSNESGEYSYDKESNDEKQSQENNVVWNNILELNEAYANIECKLAEVIPNIDEDALILLNLMLKMNPKDRISAKEALKSPFFNDVNIE